MGGVGSSLRILCDGMQADECQCDVVTTSYNLGNDYEIGRREGLPIKSICAEERWLRKRLEITLEWLSNYDVIINNHSIETQLIFPSLSKHIVRISVIHTTNEPVISGARLNSSSMDALVGISPVVTTLLRKTAINCPVYTIPNACLTNSGPYPPLDDELKIVYLGRLTQIDKNILILPEIVKALNKRGLRFSLKIAGCGSDRQRLEKKIDQIGVREHIRFLGNVTRKAAAEILSQSNFVIIPSNYEGFGLVVTEAMAAGCIPITSDIPVFSWILGRDATLLQATVEDAEQYAVHLCGIAEKPDCYSALQERLRQRQRKYFNQEATVNGYLRLIEDLRLHRIEDNYLPVPPANLSLPKYYERRRMRLWWILQKLSYGFRKRIQVN